MGKILPGYKAALISELTDSISSNTSHYYVYASNPVAYSNGVPVVSNKDCENNYEPMFGMIFGKKIKSTDIYPVIDKNIWASNTVYDRYDQSSNTLHTNNNFYVIASPEEIGGVYNIYKCIDNANGSVSTTNPGSIGTPTQTTTFQTEDNYKWRYITTISNSIWNRFVTNDYAPVYANALIQATSQTHCGVEVVMITNSGSGFEAYTNGIIQSVVNTTLLQLQSTASTDNFKYNNSAIYIYNTLLGTSQICNVSNYISNSTGRWLFLNSPSNTSIITSGESEYYISPKVVFETNGDESPIAYSVINTTSNALHQIVVLDSGSNISRANVYITSQYGSGANLYCIIPPQGGHGANPSAELNTKGMVLAFSFSNTESNTILTSNTLYNKVGIIKNPYSLQANNTKGSRFSSNTYSQVLKANVSPSHTFSTGETVVGATTGAKGIVAFSNSTHVYLVGDKSFSNGEFIGNTTVSNTTQITIITLGDIYAKDLAPIYVQNINNINRSDTQNESYKLIIQV